MTDQSLSSHVVACNQALMRFFFCLDERRYEQVVKMFSPSGQWLRQGKLHTGAAEVMAMLRNRSETQIVRHVVSNVLVESTQGSTIIAKSYVTGYVYNGKADAQLPVAIRGAHRLFVGTTEFEPRGNAIYISKHGMEPVFDFHDEGQHA